MEEYYFLFALAFVFTLFATIQDLKTREVSNWLNFSFIAFALAYRAFYSVATRNYEFFLMGFLGFVIFFALAYAFYYSRVFAGGDAKLLMGYGAILPFTNYLELFILTMFFLIILFSVGTVYSLIYSIFIALKNKKRFSKELKKTVKKQKSLLAISSILFVISVSAGFINPFMFVFSVIFLIPLILIYTQALDRCMVSLTPPNKLTEGDWLVSSVKLSPKLTIKKTVHGLSFKDIQLLKKYRKKVLIKSGIPFVPVFLLTLLIMVFFLIILKLSPLDLIFFLS